MSNSPENSQEHTTTDEDVKPVHEGRDAKVH